MISLPFFQAPFFDVQQKRIPRIDYNDEIMPKMVLQGSSREVYATQTVHSFQRF